MPRVLKPCPTATLILAQPLRVFQNRASYSSKKTKQYDAEAMRYLSYALYPLVIGYSIYALFYKTHKSWYSWVLSSLVGAVYMFGFILMCPQVREGQNSKGER